MSKQRKPKGVRSVFLRRLTAWTLFLGLMGAVLLTVAVAQLYFNALEDSVEYLSEKVFYHPGLGHLYENDAEDSYLPGFVEHRLLMACDYGNDCWAYPSISHDRWRFLQKASDMTQSAVVIADYGGNVRYTNGDYYYFSCVTDEEWQASGTNLYLDPTRYVFVRFDPETFTDEGKVAYETEPHAYFWTLRLTGVMDGNELIPDKIEMLDYDEYNNGDAFYRDVRDGKLPWTVLYQRETPQTDHPVVLHAMQNVEVSVYDPGKPLRFEGQQYASLQALTVEQIQTYYRQDTGDFHLREANLFRFLSMETFHIHDREVDSEGMLLSSEGLYNVTMALCASPLLMAAYCLRWVYVLTLLAALLLIRRMDKLFSQKILRPLNTVNEGIADGWRNIWDLWEEDLLAEPARLLDHYTATKSTLVDNKNEINRLQTALNYAKEAEENRRQLTSAIAHELKTPLAVIHSYAEGLQENINESKREHYLRVILSEVQSMDDMVLEMLDLSRLEAGKVKLARDEFSLPELARSIFGRLELALAVKELTVEYDFSHSGTVTADEGRIGQVITNFATNALKYTSPGGTIRVRTECRMGKILFEVENNCEPLPQGTLDKLWDSFYRADSARSGEGTGLGLAICKRIIELHGGQISARNTPSGVAFQFQI